MNNPSCRICGAKMKGNGKTSAGTKRWRCSACGASSTRKIDSKAKALTLFLKWLLSKDSAAEAGTSRTSFWRKTSWVWEIWPIAAYTGEVHDVVFLDGIWLKKKAVVLLAVANGRVVAWHLARSECSEAWLALMARMPEPAMCVCDGAHGFAKAASAAWPNTKVQRCLFHAASQIKRYTTLNPKLEAGIELLGIANCLLRVGDADAAAAWLARYAAWCSRWESFLKEFTIKEGRRVYTHERLRRARRSLNKLVHDKTLFTFIEMQEQQGGTWPSTNNAIEAVNARLREMLRLHRGMPTMHRIKAIFWWCYMHSENPLSAAEIVRVMPTDNDVDGLFATASRSGRSRSEGPEEYGSGIVWEDFHMPTRYRQ